MIKLSNILKQNKDLSEQIKKDDVNTFNNCTFNTASLKRIEVNNLFININSDWSDAHE